LPQETEIKLRAASARTARQLLQKHGFAVVKRRHYERNVLYETNPPALRPAGQLLRLREAAGEFVLTFKGPAAAAGRHKTREELEVTLQDGRQLAAILEKLRFEPGFVYEKYRTEYQRPGERGLAVLDETPIGVFLELEGAAGWIDRTARRLGYGLDDYILKSYGTLWQETGASGNFVFAQGNSKGRRSSK